MRKHSFMGVLFSMSTPVLVHSPEHCKPYRIPEPLLFPGSICIAISPDNNFCRGRVCDGPYVYANKKYYNVLWVDYGGSDHVPEHAILFVKKPFQDLPMQAIHASLAMGLMLPGLFSHFLLRAM